MKPSEILKKVRENPTKTDGLCRNYFMFYRENVDSTPSGQSDLQYTMENYGISFENWPEYSGRIFYPIKPHNRCPIATYGKCRDYWSKRTKYGQARWRLLDWLIEQFEAKGA